MVPSGTIVKKLHLSGLRRRLEVIFYGMDSDFKCDTNLGKYEIRRYVRAIVLRELGSSRVCVRGVGWSILMKEDELVFCHQTLLTTYW